MLVSVLATVMNLQNTWAIVNMNLIYQFLLGGKTLVKYIKCFTCILMDHTFGRNLNGTILL